MPGPLLEVAVRCSTPSNTMVVLTASIRTEWPLPNENDAGCASDHGWVVAGGQNRSRTATLTIDPRFASARSSACCCSGLTADAALRYSPHARIGLRSTPRPESY